MSASQLVVWAIPSPAESVWHLGPVPIRAYALCIVVGILAAVWIADKRWIARGGAPNEIADLAIWAVPFGLVGGRLYHVLTDWELYFGEDRNPVAALYVWRGGLGVWGAIAMGALGVAIGARTKHIKLLPVMDAMAPGVLVAQALGRLGNYFNQELFGRPTDLPWALEIDVAHRPAGYLDEPTFHPTFLYESLWCLAAAVVLIWADRRFRLGHGRVVALYVMAYTAGRVWIEMLRIDSVQLDNVLGLRWNVWTSIILFVLALAYFLWSRKARPGRETSVYHRVDVATGSPDPRDVEDPDPSTP